MKRVFSESWTGSVEGKLFPDKLNEDVEFQTFKLQKRASVYDNKNIMTHGGMLMTLTTLRCAAVWAATSRLSFPPPNWMHVFGRGSDLCVVTLCWSSDDGTDSAHSSSLLLSISRTTQHTLGHTHTHTATAKRCCTSSSERIYKKWRWEKSTDASSASSSSSMCCLLWVENPLLLAFI